MIVFFSMKTALASEWLVRQTLNWDNQQAAYPTA